MVEIFWKTDDLRGSPNQQELYELRLIDLGIYEKPRFIVTEFHAYWSEALQRVMWDRGQHENCGTPEEATRRYKDRRAAIIEKGFLLRSDMDILTAS